jgi:DNA helicase-2/ATP-dependent DNA helicase PcrA
LGEPRFGFGNRVSFEEHLANGFCTHDDLRAVLAGALRNPHLRGRVSAYVEASISHLVVDEVFDANRLDLYLVRLACDAGVQVTLVGDPWQALYGFRGASPELVPSLIHEGQFERLPLSRSFRFETDVMQDLARDLRGGTATTLPWGGEHDVVLASSWDALWQAPDHVLPLSFGMTTNRSDAAAIVLLNHLLQSRFSERTIFLPEAVLLLELDPDAYRLLGAAVLGSVVDTLGRQGPSEALRALRSAVVELGAPRRLRAGRAAAEQRQLDRLAALARCVRAPRVVPGMTIHQAKGREWNHVGVRLSDGEAQSLAGGLSQGIESHRALYVALTRARLGVTRVG